MRTILVVEDEAMIAMMLEDILTGAGWRVVPAMTLAAGLTSAARPLSLALLDVNLGEGVTSYPIADVLIARSIPIFFTTGYGKTGVDPRFKDKPILQKPFKETDLLKIAEALALKEDLKNTDG